MRHRSKKKEAEYRLRRPLVARLLEERQACEACLVFAAHDGKAMYVRGRSVDVHEVQSRGRGGSILDERNLMTVCRPCHTRITGHPLEASLLGLLLPSWATDDMFEEARLLRLAIPSHNEWVPSWESTANE
jgi:hypothetical protein